MGGRQQQGGQLERQVISLESASDDANGDTPTEKFSVAERLLFLHYHRGTLCNFLDMATTIDREDGVCAASMLPLSASEGDSDGTKHAQRDAPDSIDRPILMWFSNPGFGHPSGAGSSAASSAAGPSAHLYGDD